MTTRIYLDHAATTPIRPEAAAAVAEGMARWANSSSPHAEGRAARRMLEDARGRIAKALGWDGEVILTSGASEALAIGLGRAKRTRRLVSAVEHDAVFRAAPGADVLPVVRGAPDKDMLARYLTDGPPPVVAVQAINSETGTTLLSHDSDPVVAMVRDAGGLVLADASQAAGKQPLPDADMIVVSAHKLGGPPGIGALLLRDYAMVEPDGGQESGYRSGTENLPGVLGFAAALEAGGLERWATTVDQRFHFKDRLYEAGEVIQPGGQCSHIFAVAHSTLPAAAQLIRLDAMGFAVSAGSACSSGTLKRSRALAAFGVPGEVADRTIRVSLGWSTTPEELDRFANAYAGLVRR
ncbi:cysteine desulfurase family protein [Sphingomonas sp. Leaf10]|uniref:cysteine desulfurase family protein n=1 Tax=Sphingomonas sp. Leaf10 TaxID=1735676 RepID=UPI0006F89D68|nr:aminotransferase class V-fold PLP-dependent enzyme [Sphingomonas sp. Leaf10]KQM41191.1 aminotransferase [Sphingomonas sp. Leaf10]